VKAARQQSTNSTRIAGRNTSACAAATVVVSQIACAAELESFGTKPWMHGYRDPRSHPGQQDV
jgi:hypothetical protein